jgi:hypothetical protein
MDQAIYAQNKAIDYSYNETGSQTIMGPDGVKVIGVRDMSSAAMTIEQQYEAISKNFGEPVEKTKLESVVEEEQQPQVSCHRFCLQFVKKTLRSIF